MTDRDTFAAAALTGLLAQGDDGSFSEESYARAAYRWADAMLRERGTAIPDATPTQSSVPDSRKWNEPAAWAVMEREGFDIEGLFPNRDEAADWCGNRQQIVPLYRQLQHTLTDEEREAVEWAASAAANVDHPAEETLRKMLERLA